MSICCVSCEVYVDEMWSVTLFWVSNVILRMYSDSELFGVTMELWETKTHLLTLGTIGPDERQIPAEKDWPNIFVSQRKQIMVCTNYTLSWTESFDWNWINREGVRCGGRGPGLSCQIPLNQIWCRWMTRSQITSECCKVLTGPEACSSANAREYSTALTRTQWKSKSSPPPSRDRRGDPPGGENLVCFILNYNWLSPNVNFVWIVKSEGTW